jgi:hypothetical protein
VLFVGGPQVVNNVLSTDVAETSQSKPGVSRKFSSRLSGLGRGRNIFDDSRSLQEV